MMASSKEHVPATPAEPSSDGAQLSTMSFNKFLQIAEDDGPGFHSDSAQDIKWLKAIDRESGNPAAPDSKEMFNNTAGWGCTTAAVSVSFFKRFLRPNPMESVSRRLFPRISSYSADYSEQYARIISCKI